MYEPGIKREMSGLIKTKCCYITLYFKFFFLWLHFGFSFQCLYLYSKKNMGRPKLVRNVQKKCDLLFVDLSILLIFNGQAEHISPPHDLLTQATSGCTELP